MILTDPPGIVVTVDAASLALAAKANAAYQTVLAGEAQSRAGQSLALEGAVAAGLALVEAHDHLPQGQSWDGWRKKNLQFSLRTAKDYERIAREWPALSSLLDSGELSSIAQALRILRPEQTAPPCPVSPEPSSGKEDPIGSLWAEIGPSSAQVPPGVSAIPAPLRQGEDGAQSAPLAPAACMTARGGGEPIRPAQAARPVFSPAAPLILPPPVDLEVLRLREEVTRLQGALAATKTLRDEADAARQEVAVLEQERQREIAFLQEERARLQAESEALRTDNALLRGEVQRLTEAASKKKGKPPVVPPPIPASLDTPEFREAWDLFVGHRIEKKAPLTSQAMQMSLKKLQKLGVERAVKKIEFTVSQNWQGLRGEDEVVPFAGKFAASPVQPDVRLPQPTRPTRQKG